MVQAQLVDPVDGVVLFPLLGGTVAAGREEAMQHGEEDGPFDGKLEAAVFQQSSQDLADRTGLEDQGGADPSAVSDDALAASMSAENCELFGEPPERLDEIVEFAACQKFIEAPEAEQDALFHLAVDTHIVDDQHRGAGSRG